MFLLFTLMISALDCAPLMAAVIYVNSAATGANNGTSWLNAFASLSDALIAAGNGDEIWVVRGTYRPEVQVDVDGSGGSDPREVTFQIPNGVKLYGGFNGTEVTRNERDWNANITVLSGDIDNNDALTNGITYYVDDIVGNNAYHVVYTANTGPNTRVDGFVINAGSANMSLPPFEVHDPNRKGGGWYNDLRAPSFTSSPTITNTLFQANDAAYAGGGFFSGGTGGSGAMLSLIWHCDFKFNRAVNSGGGIYIAGSHTINLSPVIRGCEFFGNEVVSRGGALYLSGDHAIIDSVRFISNKTTAIANYTNPGSGGAVKMSESNAVFSTCYFAFNHSTGNSTGAKEGGGGGALHISVNHDSDSPYPLIVSEPSFFNCGFYGNTTSGNSNAWGGAVLHYNESGILRPRYANCVFSANNAKSSGSAIANFVWVTTEPEGYIPALEPLFVNCTFTKNHAKMESDPFDNSGWEHMGVEVLNATVVNSILAGNTADEESPVVKGETITYSHSLVEGSGGSGATWNATYGIDGGHNLGSSPFFKDENSPLGADNLLGTADDGLHLTPGSPGVNAGNNATPGLTGVTIDITGEPRIQGNNVDMGAYEDAGIIIFPIYLLEPWKPIPVGCLSCPWGIILTDEYFSSFDWDGEAQFTDFADHGIVSGKIVDTENREITFDVYLKLMEPAGWNEWSRMGRSWLVHTPESQRVALEEHEQWKYWELSDESFLQGTGEVEGMLRLRHAPENLRTGFQVGNGANAYDGDFGISGNFSYEGELRLGRKNFSLRGEGSLNVDAELCRTGCAPVPAIDSAATMFNADKYGSESFVYPNPARDRIEVKTPEMDGEYLINIYDQYGQLKQSEHVESEGAIVHVNLSRLLPGIHYVRMHTSSGEVRSQKIIVE